MCAFRGKFHVASAAKINGAVERGQIDDTKAVRLTIRDWNVDNFRLGGLIFQFYFVADKADSVGSRIGFACGNDGQADFSSFGTTNHLDDFVQVHVDDIHCGFIALSHSDNFVLFLELFAASGWSTFAQPVCCVA